MKNTLSILLLTTLLLTTLLSSSCIMDTKVIEVVVNGTTCVDFEQNEQSETFTKDAVVDLAAEVLDILKKAGYTQADLIAAKLIGGTYEITQYTDKEIWDISGSVTVTRLDIPSVPKLLYSYTTQEVSPTEVGITYKMELDPDGVDVLNKGLDDFVNGGNARFRVQVNNGDVNPSPSGTKPLVFTWKACIRLYVIILEEVEVPDPF